jgi:ParB-like chromosome segregation protein Spo0J
MTAPTLPSLTDLDARQIGAITEAKLIEWGIPYEYDPDVDLSTIRRVDSAQVREEAHRYDRDTAEQYAAHMRAGVTFPPVVLLNDSVLLDGNTRVAAAHMANLKTLPAFKCRFPNGELGVAFAAAMNQMGGRRLTADEARGQAEVLMRHGYADDSISRELGYGRTQVNNWRREVEAQAHAERALVVDKFEQLKKPARRTLSAVKLDAPFAALTVLAADTQVAQKELNRITGDVLKASSEADALDVISTARTNLAPAGPPPHRAGRTQTELTKAALGLGQLLALDGRELNLVESNPEKRGEWLEKWTRVRDLADKVIALHA